MGEDKGKITLKVNGVEREVTVGPDTKLADVLRAELGLTGTKIGCSDGQCGSCAVLLDGRTIRSCVYPARRAAGKEVLTVEGLAASWGEPAELHPLQQAFVDHGAIQCGYCTPGMILKAYSLLADNPTPSRAEIIDGMDENLCRCGAHTRIVAAIETASREMKGGMK